MAAPSIYTEELADEICRRLASGLSLNKVCAAEDMPAKWTVFDWARKKPEFAAKYAAARELMLESLADELIDIADDGSNDYREVERNGRMVVEVDHDHIQRSRLRVDTRKWTLSKLLPKKFGDKQHVEHDVGETLESLISKSMGKSE